MRFLGPVLYGVLLVGLVLSPAAAQEKPAQPSIKKIEQDYRQFFKKPETALEYWAALKFEIEVGRFDLAAEDLKGFLAKKPTKDELLLLEEQEGMSAFLRLLAIKETREDAKILLDLVTQTVKEHRGDPERINRFIRNLSLSPEERTYALGELRKSGALAMPYVVQALRAATDSEDRARLTSTLISLNPTILPPLMAALDTDDTSLKLSLLAVVEERRDKKAIPGLWYLAGSSKQPELVQKKAREILVLLTGMQEWGELPLAKVALTREAERYYQHQVPFNNPDAVEVWQWQNNQLVAQPMTSSQAEEYFGLRYAGQALDLDPTYEPAQVVFTSLAVEKGFERAGVDQPLDKGAAQVKDLVRSVSPKLLIDVLDRAISDNRIAVILGSVRAVGDLGEVQALRPKGQKDPPLLRALNYPDRRVQLAAADAVLRIPNPGVVPAAITVRVVEILRRAIADDAQARVIIGDANYTRGVELGRSLTEAGWMAEARTTGTDVLKRLGEAADIDAIFLTVDAGQKVLPRNPSQPFWPNPPPQVVSRAFPLTDSLPTFGLPITLSQLRADMYFGRLPVIILMAPDQTGKVPLEFEQALRHMAARYHLTWVETYTTSGEALNRSLTSQLAQSMVKPLSAEERKANAVLAMQWLKRLARNEVPGYDVRPAVPAILLALRNPELVALAIEASERLPGSSTQRELARLTLDANLPVPVRSVAAQALALNMQRFGVSLSSEIAALEQLHSQTEEAQLKSNLATVLGSVQPDPNITGQRLQKYKPEIVQPAKEK